MKVLSFSAFHFTGLNYIIVAQKYWPSFICLQDIVLENILTKYQYFGLQEKQLVCNVNSLLLSVTLTGGVSPPFMVALMILLQVVAWENN